MNVWLIVLAVALVVAIVVAIKGWRDAAEYRRHRDLQNRWRS